MKRITLAALTITLSSFVPVNGGTIVVEQFGRARFAGARLGEHLGTEPFFASAIKGDAIALLHLGDYSEADVGTTHTFTRDTASADEWDAFVALRKSPNVPGADRINNLWLGLDIGQTANSNLPPSLPIAQPALKLLQVDVIVDTFHKWFDNGNTYTTAYLTVRSLTLVPEPGTCFLLIGGCIAANPIRRRKSTL